MRTLKRILWGITVVGVATALYLGTVYAGNMDVWPNKTISEHTSTSDNTATSQPPVNGLEDIVEEPNNSYGFAESLGLEADYLKELNFDDNAKEFISYLSSLPEQMRTIAVDSGLVKKLNDKQAASGLVDDKQINSDELEYFKRVVGSYQKEIETFKPWLNQISEQDSLEALTLNLSNFLEVSKDEMFDTLDGDKLPSLLPQALFVADGVKRKYAAEVINPDGLGRTVKPYAAAMVQTIQNFWQIHNNTWEIATNPDYKPRGKSVEDILDSNYFEA